MQAHPLSTSAARHRVTRSGPSFLTSRLSSKSVFGCLRTTRVKHSHYALKLRDLAGRGGRLMRHLTPQIPAGAMRPPNPSDELVTSAGGTLLLRVRPGRNTCFEVIWPVETVAAGQSVLTASLAPTGFKEVSAC
jgi:hypothetical protein